MQRDLYAAIHMVKNMSKVPDGQYYYMKYYVTSDIHGFYMEFQDALKSSGYYEDKEPHKLIIIRDLFDRGSEAKRLQAFILYNMENLILIRGNHEEL